MAEHGLTDACGPCCERLMAEAGACAERWHTVALWAAVYQLQGQPSGKARANAMRKAGYKTPGSSESILSRELVNACYAHHLAPVSQEPVDIKAMLEDDLAFEIAERDFADYFKDTPDPEALSDLVRVLILGVEKKNWPGEQIDNLFGSGCRYDYEKGRTAPPPKRILELAARCGAEPMQTLKALKELGLSKYIVERKFDRGRWSLKLESRRSAQRLLAATQGLVVERRAITFDEAQQHYDRVWEAFAYALRVRVSEADTKAITIAASWWIGEEVEIGGRLVRRKDREELQWTEEGWRVAVPGMELVRMPEAG